MNEEASLGTYAFFSSFLCFSSLLLLRVLSYYTPDYFIFIPGVFSSIG